jgi:hypothetical protein
VPELQNRSCWFLGQDVSSASSVLLLTLRYNVLTGRWSPPRQSTRKCGDGGCGGDVIENLSHQLTTLWQVPRRIGGNLSKEAFHQIEPGSAGGGKVPVITGMGGKPGLHPGMSVSGLVVQHQINGQPTRRAALDPLPKAQKLLMA